MNHKTKINFHIAKSPIFNQSQSHHPIFTRKKKKRKKFIHHYSLLFQSMSDLPKIYGQTHISKFPFHLKQSKSKVTKQQLSQNQLIGLMKSETVTPVHNKNIIFNNQQIKHSVRMVKRNNNIQKSNNQLKQSDGYYKMNNFKDRSYRKDMSELPGGSSQDQNVIFNSRVLKYDRRKKDNKQYSQMDTNTKQLINSKYTNLNSFNNTTLMQKTYLQTKPNTIQNRNTINNSSFKQEQSFTSQRQLLTESYSNIQQNNDFKKQFQTDQSQIIFNDQQNSLQIKQGQQKKYINTQKNKKDTLKIRNLTKGFKINNKNNANLNPNNHIQSKFDLTKHQNTSINNQIYYIDLDDLQYFQEKPLQFNQLNSHHDSNQKNQSSIPIKTLTKKCLRSKYFRIKIPQNTKQQLNNFIKQYQFINPQVQNLKNNQNIAYIYYKNSKAFYFGEVLNKKRHGFGVYVSESYIFQGIFQNNLKFKGYQINSQGVYNGNFQNNLRNGQGQYCWYNGEYYIGHWQNNKKHGNGRWEKSINEWYEGQWKQNIIIGFGIYMFSQDHFYKGNFENYMKNGQGQQWFANGDYFKGRYKEGMAQNGKYIWNGGKQYFEGNFRENKRDGSNCYYKSDIIEYKGDYVNDKKNGEGELRYKNIYRLVGIFQNNKFMKGQKINIKGEK